MQGQDVQHSLVPQEDQGSTTQPTGVQGVTPSHPSLTSVDQQGIQSPQQPPVNVGQSDLAKRDSSEAPSEMAQGMCMCTSMSTGNCYMHTTYN